MKRAKLMILIAKIDSSAQKALDKGNIARTMILDRRITKLYKLGEFYNK